jgi:hypothetical protein
MYYYVKILFIYSCIFLSPNHLYCQFIQIIVKDNLNVIDGAAVDYNYEINQEEFWQYKYREGWN